MHWKKGTSRKVLVIPALGICLKFARTRPWTALSETIAFMRTDKGWSLRGGLRYWQYPIRDWGGARGMVFRGIQDNLREAWFSWCNSHPVLARTYLSLGLMNVQELVVENPTGFDLHFRRFEDVVGWRTLNDSGDLHAFTHNNFGVRDGKAVVVDYASLAMQKVLAEYGDRIHNELDLVSPP